MGEADPTKTEHPPPPTPRPLQVELRGNRHETSGSRRRVGGPALTAEVRMASRNLDAEEDPVGTSPSPLSCAISGKLLNLAAPWCAGM